MNIDEIKKKLDEVESELERDFPLRFQAKIYLLLQDSIEKITDDNTRYSLIFLTDLVRDTLINWDKCRRVLTTNPNDLKKKYSQDIQEIWNKKYNLIEEYNTALKANEKKINDIHE